MATAIYLLLHVLLTLHHWHSFFPSYGGLCPLLLNLSGHLWVSWPREFDKSDAMCALKSLQLLLSLSLSEMLILGPSHHAASKHRPHGETAWRCFSSQLQLEGSQHQWPNMCKIPRWVQPQLPSHCDYIQDPELASLANLGRTAEKKEIMAVVIC